MPGCLGPSNQEEDTNVSRIKVYLYPNSLVPCLRTAFTQGVKKDTICTDVVGDGGK